jgi:RsiW-degrading membrane proteinase PrsW (M82 family)
VARWTLIAGAALVLAIAAGRFAPIALIVAAALLPVLYLIYFYDVEVYEDAPISVLAGTFVAGAVLGTALSLGFYRTLIAQRPLSLHLAGGVTAGPSSSYILTTGVALPLLGLVATLIGPLALFLVPSFRARFDDILDGMVFGVASGLGFAAAQSVVYSWLIITGPLQRGGAPLDWALPALRVALLTPIISACAAGLICAALWLTRDPHVRQRPASVFTSLPYTIIVAAIGVIAPSLLTIFFSDAYLSFLWYLLTAVAFLLLARVTLHLGLLEKGAEDQGGNAMIVCHTCHRLTPDLAFCAQCGVALRASVQRGERNTATAPGSSPAQEGGQA